MTANEYGPGSRAGAVVDEQPSRHHVVASVRHPYVVAVEMLADSAVREQRIDRAAFSEGYRAGFMAGREVGYRAAENDMARAWSYLAAKVRGLAMSPKHDELERIRWDGRREDFGKPRPGDHPGGPKDWNGNMMSGRGRPRE
ncbi:hypothetical protein [Actinomadura sp. 9N407]|uniref:hypothetical protein n=1 Tax=Actinomadura sp. 9N407 TaxID=3375154 RepID=UPI0037AF1C09